MERRRPAEEALIARLQSHLTRRHTSRIARNLARRTIEELRVYRSVRP